MNLIQLINHLLYLLNLDGLVAKTKDYDKFTNLTRDDINEVFNKLIYEGKEIIEEYKETYIIEEEPKGLLYNYKDNIYYVYLLYDIKDNYKLVIVLGEIDGEWEVAMGYTVNKENKTRELCGRESIYLSKAKRTNTLNNKYNKLDLHSKNKYYKDYEKLKGVYSVLEFKAVPLKENGAGIIYAMGIARYIDDDIRPNKDLEPYIEQKIVYNEEIIDIYKRGRNKLTKEVIQQKNYDFLLQIICQLVKISGDNWKIAYVHDLNDIAKQIVSAICYRNRDIILNHRQNPSQEAIKIARRNANKLKLDYEEYINKYGYEDPELPFDMKINKDRQGANVEGNIYELTIRIGNNTIRIRDSKAILKDKIAILSTPFEVPKEYELKEINIDKCKLNNLVENRRIREEFHTNIINHLKSHLIIINKLRDMIWESYKIDITSPDGPKTAASLAVRVLQVHYPDEYHAIPRLNRYNKDMYTFIRESLFGGIAAVYHPALIKAKDRNRLLYHYDLNSFYPYCALMPLPSREYKYNIYPEDKPLKCKTVEDIKFGYHRAKVVTPVWTEKTRLNSNKWIGILPVRVEGGKTVYPLGSFEGTWTSPELCLALEHGYKIKILESYEFKQEHYFKKYITEIYELKQTASGSVKALYKLLLNSLLGRYGIHLDRREYKYIPPINYKLINISRKSQAWHTKCKILKDYISSYRRFEEKAENIHDNYIFNLDANLEDDKERFRLGSISNVAITSMIYAYARVHLLKCKIALLDNDREIYYCDTDSLVIDGPLPNTLPGIEPKQLLGSELGQWKLEGEIKEAYFIRPKLYCEVTTDDKFICRSSGTTRELTLKDYQELYKGASVRVKRVASVPITLYEYQTVSYEQEKYVTLNPEYKSRIKIYRTDEEGNNHWIDTRPIELHNYKYEKYTDDTIVQAITKRLK